VPRSIPRRETLRTNSELFLRLSREALGRDQVGRRGRIKERELAIAHLVSRCAPRSSAPRRRVQALERERATPSRP